MTSTARRLLVLAAVSAVAASGCGTAVRTGAAAVVGTDRITDTSLQQMVDRGLAAPEAKQGPGSDKPGYTRAVLLRLIEHDLLARAAKDEQVSVDGNAVDATHDRIVAQLHGEAQLNSTALKAGIAPADLPQTIRDVALRDALADKLTAKVPVDQAQLRAGYQSGIAQYDQVHSAHILVGSATLAARLLKQVTADPALFAGLAARYSTDPGSKDKGGDLGFVGRGAFAKPFEQAIFSHAPGSFVLAHTTFGYHVIHILERHTTTFEQAEPDLRRGLLNQARATAVNDLLTRMARRLGVRVNPRFGRWDAKTSNVVAAGSSVSSPAGGPSPSAPPATPGP